MRQMNARSFLILLVVCINCTSTDQKIDTSKPESNTGSLLQAISIIDAKTAWISGHEATFLRTIDGGKSWEAFKHESDTLQFRDLHAIDEDNIILMSAGPGAASRIFRFSTAYGWKETYVMDHPEGFLNTIEFWDDEKGLAFGDSFNGHLFVLKTTDGGNTWYRIDPKKIPPAGKGEGGFAASGTCITTLPGGKAWIATGAGGNARVLSTTDFGETWKSIDTPMPKGPMAGTFSIRMATEQLGTLSGGDLEKESPSDHLALTEDGGETWQLVKEPVIKGTLYGSDLVQLKDQWYWFICGPNGMDYSTNLGETWQNLDTLNYWAIDLHPNGYGYAVGKGGNIIRIDLQ